MSAATQTVSGGAAVRRIALRREDRNPPNKANAVTKERKVER